MALHRSRGRTAAVGRGAAAWLLVVAVVTIAAPPAHADEVAITRNLEIPVSSGNVLRGDLYVPVIDGEPASGLPTIVTYFPYVKDDTSRFEVTAMHRFARAGYAGLLVDIAGTGVSPGEFGFFSEREIADGHDVVEWAALQPFSNGRVGMWGYSYPGVAAAHVAATRPPHLRAVVPASIFHDIYRDVAFPGGIQSVMDLSLLGAFVAAQTVARQRPDTDPALALEALADSVATPGGLATMAEALTHTTYDAYWQERALENKIHRIEVPTLLWSGWSDVYPRGTLLNRHDIGAEHVRLVMGPWGHLAGASGEPLELFLDESLRWFDTFLRRDPAPAEADAISGGAKIFDLDWTSDERYAGTWPGDFVELPVWPPPVEDLTLRLCADGAAPDAGAPWPIQGALAADCPEDGSLPVVSVPVDATGGRATIADGAVADPFLIMVPDDKDQRLSLLSTALLTAPLEEEILLTGLMTLSLTATTAGVDTDWVVRVVDVAPDDTVRVIAPGWLRASHRHEDPDRPYLWHTHDRSDLLTPGEPYDLTVEVWPSSYRVPAGHRVGVLVRTADTITVAPSAGSVVSTILTGPGTSSALTLPVRTAARGAAPDPGSDAAAPGDESPGDDAALTVAVLPATGGGGTTAALGALILAALLATWGRPRRIAARASERGLA